MRLNTVCNYLLLLNVFSYKMWLMSFFDSLAIGSKFAKQG